MVSAHSSPVQQIAAGDTAKQACMALTARLAAAGCEDAAFDAHVLCSLALCDAQAERFDDEAVLRVAQAAALEAFAARRAAREPLQYICGKWAFLNFELRVGQGVLCPRADTEVVVEAAAACLRHRGAALALPCYSTVFRDVAPCVAAVASMPHGHSACDAQPQGAQQAEAAAPQVLELCGGSGCIGLGMKAFCPRAQVTIVEKSPEALVYLRENARHALKGIVPMPEGETSLSEGDMLISEGDMSMPEGAQDGAAFAQVIEGDLFTYHETLAAASFDVVVSNPPYLTAAEMQDLQPETAREPAMALAAGEDGLVFYRALAKDYLRVVKPCGFLVLEIGWQQAQAVRALLKESGWGQVWCVKDYAGNDRCLIAQRAE